MIKDYHFLLHKINTCDQKLETIYFNSRLTFFVKTNISIYEIVNASMIFK